MAVPECFIPDHFQSHYKKLSKVKGKIDNSTPTAMLKDVRRQASRLKRVTTIEHTTYNDRHKDVVYKECILSSSHSDVDIARYHTQTGRDVSLLNITRTHSSSPLKPSLKHITMYPPLEDTNHHGNGNYSNSERDNTDCEGSYKTKLIMNERNTRLRESLSESVLEYQYNEFLLQLTSNILSSDDISNSDEIERIIKIHIEKNKQKLREDVMLKKINELKKQLGL